MISTLCNETCLVRLYDILLYVYIPESQRHGKKEKKEMEGFQESMVSVNLAEETKESELIVVQSAAGSKWS